MRTKLSFCWVALIVVVVSNCNASSVKNLIRVGARPSPLAQIQATAVAEALLENNASKIKTQVLSIQATGDHTRKSASTQSLPLGASAVDFTGRLDEALLVREIDVAVHSLKDVPPKNRWRGKDLLQIASHLPREDPRDVLVGPYRSIRELPPKAKVGTSSVRRQSQLLALRPDLNLVNLRGNVETRLGALTDGTVDALILAQAGLNRLKKQRGMHQDCNPIPSEDLLPGACQGIVAAVCRCDDAVTRDYLASIDEHDACIAATIERAFLETVDAFRPNNYDESNVAWTGRPPMAALMTRSEGDSNKWLFRALLARPDGSKVIRQRRLADQQLTVQEALRIGRESGEKTIQDAGESFYQ